MGDLTSSLVTNVAPSSSDSSWKMNENAVDKYDLSLRSEPKRHKTWQGQYVQDMLDGLKNKTTDQKLDDAFDALDHFMGPGAKKTNNFQTPYIQSKIQSRKSIKLNL